MTTTCRQRRLARSARIDLLYRSENEVQASQTGQRVMINRSSPNEPESREESTAA